MPVSTLRFTWTLPQSLQIHVYCDLNLNRRSMATFLWRCQFVSQWTGDQIMASQHLIARCKQRHVKGKTYLT